MTDIRGHFPGYLQAVLRASADHGVFGMSLLEALYRQFPTTVCENCGVCCNAISIFSLEYHYLMRDLMGRLPPEQLRRMFQRIFSWPSRMVENGGERRLRCPFRDDVSKVCLVHPVRPFACRLFGMKKADGSRDCSRVREIIGSEPSAAIDFEALQLKVMENSEGWEVFPGQPEIRFFPLDFWVLRYALGPGKALDIYREVLVPASSPLSELWKSGPVAPIS